MWLAIGPSDQIFLAIAVNILGFFFLAIVCHGELARRRPPARYLTAFYLWLSLGGVIGGIFAGLIAQQVFSWVAEYPLLIVLAALCRPGLTLCARPSRRRVLGRRGGGRCRHADRRPWSGTTNSREGVQLLGGGISGAFARLLSRRPEVFGGHRRRRSCSWSCSVRTAAIAISCAAFSACTRCWKPTAGNSASSSTAPSSMAPSASAMTKAMPVTGRPEVLTYYHDQSPMAQGIERDARAQGRPVKLAVVGSAPAASPARPSRATRCTYYEIDRAVVRIALDPNRFTYLAKLRARSDHHCRRRAADARRRQGRPIRRADRRRLFLGCDPDASADQGGDGDVYEQDRARRHHPDACLQQAHEARAGGGRHRRRPTTWSRASTSRRRAPTTTTINSARPWSPSPARTRISGRSPSPRNWNEQEADEDEWVWTDDYSNVHRRHDQANAGRIEAGRARASKAPVAQSRSVRHIGLPEEPRDAAMAVAEIENDLKAAIRTIPDYPKPGIMFRDITTLARLGARLPPRGRRIGAALGRIEDRQDRRHRGARLHHRRGDRASAVGRLRADPQEGQAAAQERAGRLFARIRHRRDGDARGRGRKGRARDPGRRSDRDRRDRGRRGQAAAPDGRRGRRRGVHGRPAGPRRRRQVARARRGRAHAGDIRGSLVVVRNSLQTSREFAKGISEPNHTRF